MTGSAPSAAPTTSSERDPLLDLLRGVALFGIFMVNLPMIALSSSGAFEPPPDGIERAAWWVMQVGFQFKFVSLYSLLFGVGLAHFMSRASRARATSSHPEASGRGAVLGVRRMAGLLLFGLAHAILVWSGDILVTYAILGLPFLLVIRCRAGTLAVLAAVIFVASLGLSLWSSLSYASEWDGPVVTETVAEELTDEPGDAALAPDWIDLPFGSRWDRSHEVDIIEATDGHTPFLRPWVILFDLGIETWDPAWEAYEFRVLRDGPFIEACGLRFASMIQGNRENFDKWNWHILALFCLGAALFKAEVLGVARPGGVASERARQRRVWLRRSVWLLIPGLLLEWLFAASVVAETGHLVDWFAWMGAVHSLGAVLMMLGIVGAIACLLDCAPLAPFLTAPSRAVGRLGRMGLTGYIAENTAGAFLMYSWGLGWIGEVSRVTLAVLAIGIWTALVVVAHLWFGHLRTGPLEWLWRRMTYGAIRSSPQEGAARGRDVT